MDRPTTTLFSLCLLVNALSGCSREVASKGQIHAASSVDAGSSQDGRTRAAASRPPTAPVPATAPEPQSAEMLEPPPEVADEPDRPGLEGQPLTQREEPLNAAPLGLEIGYANLMGTRTKLTDLEAAGTNEYSRGPMYRADGSGLGLTGLKHVLLIFTPDERLHAVLMTFPKDPKGAFPLLRQKYRVVESHIDTFLNRGTARLEKGDSWIEIEAPHLSFEMEIRYLSKAFQAEYEKQKAQREQVERRRNAEQL